MEQNKGKFFLSGALAGITNGFFGGGGGSVFVPLLTKVAKVPQRNAFATSVAVILPLCVLSLVIYFFRAGVDFALALPYLLGGAVGGFAGGKIFKGTKIMWLKRGFGLLLIVGGIRCIL